MNCQQNYFFIMLLKFKMEIIIKRKYLWLKNYQSSIYLHICFKLFGLFLLLFFCPLNIPRSHSYPHNWKNLITTRKISDSFWVNLALKIGNHEQRWVIKREYLENYRCKHRLENEWMWRHCISFCSFLKCQFEIVKNIETLWVRENRDRNRKVLERVYFVDRKMFFEYE